MPAIVVLGAQWGDEGKGKATDQLATDRPDRLRRPHQRWPQRRPHDRRRRREVRHPPAAQRHPDARCHVGDRRRRRGLARGALPRARRAGRARRGGGGARGQRQRPRDRALPLHDRQGHRALPRQEPDRHHRPRHRPGVRRQDQPRRHPHRRPLRREDPRAEGRGGPRRAQPPADQGLQPPRDRGRAPSSRSSRRTPTGCGPWSRHLAAAQPGARRRPDRALRGRAGHDARRRPRHLPVRHLVATRSPAASASAPASARPASTG